MRGREPIDCYLRIRQRLLQELTAEALLKKRELADTSTRLIYALAEGETRANQPLRPTPHFLVLISASNILAAHDKTPWLVAYPKLIAHVTRTSEDTHRTETWHNG